MMQIKQLVFGEIVKCESLYQDLQKANAQAKQLAEGLRPHVESLRSQGELPVVENDYDLTPAVRQLCAQMLAEITERIRHRLEELDRLKEQRNKKGNYWLDLEKQN